MNTGTMNSKQNGNVPAREWNLSCKFYLGSLKDKADKYKIEKVFKRYGQLKNVWVATNPPGFAFIEYEDPNTTEGVFKEMYNIKTCVNPRVPKVSKYWQKNQGGNSEQSINIKTPTDKRPGDWLCPKDGCFNVNFSWRESCNKCNTRNPSIKETKQERTKRIYGKNAENNHLGRERDDDGISVRISNRERNEYKESNLHHHKAQNDNRYKPYNKPFQHNTGKSFRNQPSNYRPYKRPLPYHGPSKAYNRGPTQYNQEKLFSRPPPDFNRNKSYRPNPAEEHQNNKFTKPPPRYNLIKPHYKGNPENNLAMAIKRESHCNPNLRYPANINEEKNFDRLRRLCGPNTEQNHNKQSIYEGDQKYDRNYKREYEHPSHPIPARNHRQHNYNENIVLVKNCSNEYNHCPNPRQ